MRCLLLVASVALLACANTGNVSGGVTGGTTTTPTDGGNSTPDAGSSTDTGSSTTTDAGSTTPADATAAPGLPSGPAIELVTNKQYLGRALMLIQTAKTSLDILQFETTDDALKPGTDVNILVNAVVAARDRGVAVRFLMDDEVTANKPLVQFLVGKGVQAKQDGPKIRSHTKLIAAEGGFLLGSTNWSYSSISKNNEANVLVRDADARSKMASYFDKIWKSSGSAAKLTYDASAVVGVYGDAGYAAVVGPLIDKATTHIELCTYGMNVNLKDSSSPVTQTVLKLAAAVKRGVKVRALLDVTPDASPEGADINAQASAALSSLGIEVRSDPPTVITHAKFLVIDGAAVVGTNNWGYLGFQADHEAGVRSNDSALLKAILAYFDKIWAESSP